MIRKILAVALGCSLALSGAALAAIDVNAADENGLTSVKGIGPSLAKAIVGERGKQGAFKDADDLAGRVKGLGPKSVGRLQNEGLTIGAKAAAPSVATAAAVASSATAVRPATAAPTRRDAKADHPAVKAAR